ncbi:MAG: hypothetical protein AB7E30_10130 [Lawsonibacter sp.]
MDSIRQNGQTKHNSQPNRNPQDGQPSPNQKNRTHPKQNGQKNSQNQDNR